MEVAPGDAGDEAAEEKRLGGGGDVDDGGEGGVVEEDVGVTWFDQPDEGFVRAGEQREDGLCSDEVAKAAGEDDGGDGFLVRCGQAGDFLEAGQVGREVFGEGRVGLQAARGAGADIHGAARDLRRARVSSWIGMRMKAA
jgi:hypothetical protein